MVYFYTSNNVKLLKNIILDYGNHTEMSPYEYIKSYVENNLEPADEPKVSWILETFLDLKKHDLFFNKLLTLVADDLTNDNKEYFVIILHGLIFQMIPSDKASLYKCLFNVSKPLLNLLTRLLVKNEFLTVTCQIAESLFDTNYITEKITEPLIEWQPALNEMAENYDTYLKEIERLRTKDLTIPIEPKVLTRTGKVKKTYSQSISIPTTPPNSELNKNKRLLTKSDIDKRLQTAYNENKQKAMKLLNDVKSKTCHYAQKKSDGLSKTSFELQNEELRWKKYSRKPNLGTSAKMSTIPVKETTANLKRINKRIMLTEQEEVQWLQDLVNDCKNTTKIQELEEYDREERERERILDVEKKHLLGQISFEEAVLAKKRVHEENKRKYEEVIRQKEIWNEEIEKWNNEQLELNRKNFEKFSLIELNVIEAKQNVSKKNKELAEKLKKESEQMIFKALKDKQEELKRKIQMIKELKILSIIAKRAKIPKIIDLTETSGLGLLCEMSIAELQERLCSMKITLKEELETKNKVIKEKRDRAKKELDEARKNIKDFLDERKEIREKIRKPAKVTKNISSKEIDNLKTILEEKRKLRLNIMN